jgi:hypothetical protein
MTICTSRIALLVATTAAGLAASGLAATAAVAAPSCSRGGGRILAASPTTRVIAIAQRPRSGETRRDRIFACRVPTGQRFALFYAVRLPGVMGADFNSFTIVSDRYVGVIHSFGGFEVSYTSASVYDARTGSKLHDTGRCSTHNLAPGAAASIRGIVDAVFLPRGELAYSCGRLRIADTRGDRQLEPPGTDVHALAVAYGPRLYWTVVAPNGATQTKSLLLTSP